MIHIFRNIVDHGVESEDERLEKQKPTKGILKVQLKRREDFFTIIISDDGRGISPDLIRKKALEKEILTKNKINEIEDENLINLIFHQVFRQKTKFQKFQEGESG